MSKAIAYCGLDCNKCLSFLATKSDDDEKCREVAELWSKLYNANIDPSEYDSCEKLGQLFQMAPEAKDNLDRLRKDSARSGL